MKIAVAALPSGDGLNVRGPTAPLSMDPRAMSVDADLDALAASVELMREVGHQPALREWTTGEVYPGPDVRTREEVRDLVRKTVGSYHHQVGTCKMGQDPDAVVDPELRVYGRVDHAVHHDGQHERADVHDRREGLGSAAGSAGQGGRDGDLQHRVLDCRGAGGLVYR